MDAVDVLVRELGEVVKDFRKNPFTFLYEAEIQAVIFSRAADALEGSLVPIRGGANEISHYGHRPDILTRRVHMEYPSDVRFDLAVIEGGRAPQRGPSPLLNDAFWTQPVRFALEVKYCQLGDRVGDHYRRLLADIEKIERYGRGCQDERAFGGLGLLFVQSRSPGSLDAIRSYLDVVDEVTARGDAVQGYVIAESGVYRLERVKTGS